MAGRQDRRVSGIENKFYGHGERVYATRWRPGPGESELWSVGKYGRLLEAEVRKRFPEPPHKIIWLEFRWDDDDGEAGDDHIQLSFGDD